MGKYLTSCKKQPSPTSAAVEGDAAAVASCLTLRSGRRVLPAASGGQRRRPRRGERRCAKNGARKCVAVTSSSAAASWLRRCGAVDRHGGEAAPELSPQRGDVVVLDESCGERRSTPISGDVVKHDRAASCRFSSPPEAEIEAFFAEAELAERQRFAVTYNYDVALDRPLQGRFDWAPYIQAGDHVCT